MVNGRLTFRDCDEIRHDTCLQEDFQFLGNQATLLSDKHVYYEGELEYNDVERKYGYGFYVELKLGLPLEETVLGFPEIEKIRTHVTVKNHFTLVNDYSKEDIVDTPEKRIKCASAAVSLLPLP